MSQARIEKLNLLLARVQQRRAEPRLVSVPGLGGEQSARSENTNLASAAAPSARIPSEPPPPTPFDESFAELTGPSSMPPPAHPALAHEAAPLAKIHSSIPAAPSELDALGPRSTPGSRAEPRPSTVPPAHVSEPPLPITADASVAPVRVAPSPSVPFDSAVRVASSPRIDAAKSFGELLELSLSLRPKA
jgi:hypothetical protein